MSDYKDIKKHIADIKTEAKQFIETNLDYYQLLGFKISAKALALMFRIFGIALFSTLALIFLSFAAAFAIGSSLESVTLGFLIVGAVYLILVALLYTFRKTLIDIPILKKISDIFFNN